MPRYRHVVFGMAVSRNFVEMFFEIKNRTSTGTLTSYELILLKRVLTCCRKNRSLNGGGVSPWLLQYMVYFCGMLRVHKRHLGLCVHSDGRDVLYAKAAHCEAQKIRGS